MVVIHCRCRNIQVIGYMENCVQSPPIGGGNEVGVQDKGSGVRGRRGLVQEDDLIEYQDNCRVLVPSVDGEITQPNEVNDDGMQYVSPTKTFESVQIVVESNHDCVVSYLEEPKIGMIFRKWEEVEEYYMEYAEQKGFGVSRVQGVYSKGEVRDRISMTWRCECYGRPDMRAQREAKKRAKAMEASGSGGVIGGVVGDDELSRSKRRSKKCECQDNIYASINREGQWVIRRVQLEHTGHAPIPSDTCLVKEYRMKHFNTRDRKTLYNYFDKGVPVKQIHGCMGTELAGSDPLSYTVKDLEHEVYKRGNQNFYYAHRLDAEGRLKDVLWVDARSRASYEEFGDVICFDATYLTNNYDLPFANFVGVNHHGQSILLGCALVSHEDCDTFRWVFQQWLHYMNENAPKAILTDQAAAMRQPLEEVMPTTRHRWCIWHIMRKLPEKLGKCDGYQDFKSKLKYLIYESFTIQDFENRWSEFVVKYKLETNEWLQILYKERHMWVPAFMRDFFWADMKTTQRVESINSFFDGFLNRKTKLFEFPQKYDKAMEKRIDDETDADAKCGKYIRRLVTGFAVEKLFQKIYTDTKFQEVRIECRRLMYCYPREENILSETLVQYLIEGRVWIVPEGKSEAVLTDRRRFYSATFHTETKVVCCDCRKFETDGIICRHIIRILDLNQVVDIPERYVLKRWQKDLLRKHTRVKASYHNPSKVGVWKRYNMMMNAFEQSCEEAAMVDDGMVKNVLTTLDQLQSKNAGSSTENGTTYMMHNPLHNIFLPNIAPIKPVPNKRGRGRPKGSRNKGLPSSGYKKASNNFGQNAGCSSQNRTTSTVHNPNPDTFLPSTAPLHPVPNKRGRGRPKGSCNKGLASMGYKKARHNNGQVPNASCSSANEINYTVSLTKDPVPSNKGRGRPKGRSSKRS
ncbi:protein FAR-RED IMPAIRED RESPONSE 1-like [Chenopodium quinoa]|uniref:protein FAR-RED IMPAIRED RESPONSE 1-like n=1 Tax=Chenopodium quinoa TaxID=63459 RepID=UPI000B786CB1|nr:protein FAR-RED IMPAIRED RESPONSE 1-like [Chenopodium quinoa]